MKVEIYCTAISAFWIRALTRFSWLRSALNLLNVKAVGVINANGQRHNYRNRDPEFCAYMLVPRREGGIRMTQPIH